MNFSTDPERETDEADAFARKIYDDAVLAGKLANTALGEAFKRIDEL